jgi:hypothetical protein
MPMSLGFISFLDCSCGCKMFFTMVKKTLDLHVFPNLYLQPLYFIVLTFGYLGVVWTFLPW